MNGTLLRGLSVSLLVLLCCPLTPAMVLAVEVPQVYAISGTDGYSKLSDGSDIYTFGFADMQGVVNPSTKIQAAQFPAPTILVDEFDPARDNPVRIILGNLGMRQRPDLFDPHTVHWHGFINAATVYDGEPMASISVPQNKFLEYYYRPVDPGTYLYHCHVEATEHMEMGMLGNLAVKPRQQAFIQGALVTSPNAYTQFAYNDCDNVPDSSAGPFVPLAGLTCGSSGFDKDYFIQIADFDPDFHYADENFQPLPFANFKSRYFMLNGRGYPDTVSTANLTNKNGFDAQSVHTSITATVGQKLLLRIANLSVDNFTTFEALGLAMTVIGHDAKQMLNEDRSADLSYTANSVLLGPGESTDILLDTAGVVPGTYYLYSRELDHLNSYGMSRSGAMTEIVVN